MAEESKLLGVLNVKIIGSGKPTLVLAHGFGSDQSVWQYILPYLVAHYKVIVFDMVFSGKVDPKNFDFDRYTSLSAYAADLLSILDELKIDKCLYVGHSVSGMVGCLASIERPELFERLILLCASPRYLNEESYHGGFERGEVDSLYYALKSHYAAWASGFAPLAVGVDEPSVVEEFRRTMMNMKPEIALAVAKTIFESDMRSILCDVKTPCSIIQTAKDIVVPMAVPYHMQGNLGGKMNSVIILDAEGHLPQLTAQDLLLQAVKLILEGSKMVLEPTVQNANI
uniref:AB hydrolase-1 domain-containing protein n=1 Tax=Picea sitchensis TaxID=3332 RepID=A9NP95_PICSI|nr:unknown [Picea sitchensis]